MLTILSWAARARAKRDDSLPAEDRIKSINTELGTQGQGQATGGGANKASPPPRPNAAPVLPQVAPPATPHNVVKFNKVGLLCESVCCGGATHIIACIRCKTLLYNFPMNTRIINMLHTYHLPCCRLILSLLCGMVPCSNLPVMAPCSNLPNRILLAATELHLKKSMAATLSQK